MWFIKFEVGDRQKQVTPNNRKVVQVILLQWSDNGGSRPRNDWTPHSQILQPINNSRQPQYDFLSLPQQQQGVQQKVLTQQKKTKTCRSSKMEIFQKKLNSLEESILLVHLGVMVTRRPGSQDNSL